MLVEVWDKTTGERVPHLVPEHFVGHKILGPNLVTKAPVRAVGKADKPARKKEEDNG